MSKLTFEQLEIGQEIKLVTSDLPRVVEMLPTEGKEGEPDYKPPREGRIFTIELSKPLTVKIVALDAGIGKQVGVELPEAPEGLRWFDAHECDGATKKGYGWYVTLDDVAEANPKLVPSDEAESIQ